MRSCSGRRCVGSCTLRRTPRRRRPPPVSRHWPYRTPDALSVLPEDHRRVCPCTRSREQIACQPHSLRGLWAPGATHAHALAWMRRRTPWSRSDLARGRGSQNEQGLSQRSGPRAGRDQGVGHDCSSSRNDHRAMALMSPWRKGEAGGGRYPVRADDGALCIFPTSVHAAFVWLRRPITEARDIR